MMIISLSARQDGCVDGCQSGNVQAEADVWRGIELNFNFEIDPANVCA